MCWKDSRQVDGCSQWPRCHIYVTSMWHLYPCQGQMAFLIMRRARDDSEIFLPVHRLYMQSVCVRLYLTWYYHCCLWVWHLFCCLSLADTFTPPPDLRCLCFGMKGSIVWKRCVWNPRCLRGLRAMWEKGPLSISGMGLCAMLLFAGHPPRPCFSFVPHFLSPENRG